VGRLLHRAWLESEDYWDSNAVAMSLVRAVRQQRMGDNSQLVYLHFLKTRLLAKYLETKAKTLESRFKTKNNLYSQEKCYSKVCEEHWVSMKDKTKLVWEKIQNLVLVLILRLSRPRFWTNSRPGGLLKVRVTEIRYPDIRDRGAMPSTLMQKTFRWDSFL